MKNRAAFFFSINWNFSERMIQIKRIGMSRVPGRLSKEKGIFKEPRAYSGQQKRFQSSALFLISKERNSRSENNCLYAYREISLLDITLKYLCKFLLHLQGKDKMSIFKNKHKTSCLHRHYELLDILSPIRIKKLSTWTL